MKLLKDRVVSVRRSVCVVCLCALSSVSLSLSLSIRLSFCLSGDLFVKLPVSHSLYFSVRFLFRPVRERMLLLYQDDEDVECDDLTTP